MFILKKRTSIILLSILVTGMLFLLWMGYKTRQKIEYRNDVMYVYSVANKIGYSNDHLLMLDHQYSLGDGYYDTINVSFFTKQTDEQLAHEIRSLGFEVQNVYGPFQDNSFTDSFNINKNKKLVLLTKNSGTMNTITPIPIVKKWVLIDGDRFIDIQFASKTVSTAYWSYNSHILEGDIVIVTLNRHLKRSKIMI